MSFFSFNAVASVDYIYFRAVRVRPGSGVGVQSQFDFFCQGGIGGFKTNLNKKVGAARQFFFSITSTFFKWEGKTGRGVIKGYGGGGFKTNLNKKVGREGQSNFFSIISIFFE